LPAPTVSRKDAVSLDMSALPPARDDGRACVLPSLLVLRCGR
jgi:hypothetical protein